MGATEREHSRPTVREGQLGGCFLKFCREAIGRVLPTSGRCDALLHHGLPLRELPRPSNRNSLDDVPRYLQGRRKIVGVSVKKATEFSRKPACGEAS